MVTEHTRLTTVTDTGPPTLFSSRTLRLSTRIYRPRRCHSVLVFSVHHLKDGRDRDFKVRPFFGPKTTSKETVHPQETDPHNRSLLLGQHGAHRYKLSWEPFFITASILFTVFVIFTSSAMAASTLRHVSVVPPEPVLETLKLLGQHVAGTHPRMEEHAVQLLG